MNIRLKPPSSDILNINKQETFYYGFFLTLSYSFSFFEERVSFFVKKKTLDY